MMLSWASKGPPTVTRQPRPKSSEPEAKRAWLVTWDGSTGVPEDPVVAVLNSRMSPRSVKEFVELLYATLRYSSRDKVLYATTPKDNPHPATMTAFQKITCGDNPWLYARRVSNLKITDDNLTWTEPLSDAGRRKKIARE
jgi:hypothetical protein